MSLKFANRRPYPVSICLVWYNRDCSNPPFRKTGWLNLGPNAPPTVFLSGSLNARYYYFHAEASDGAQWGENNRRIAVTNNRFNDCFDQIYVPNRIVGLREIDTGPHTDFTVTLI